MLINIILTNHVNCFLPHIVINVQPIQLIYFILVTEIFFFHYVDNF